MRTIRRVLHSAAPLAVSAAMLVGLGSAQAAATTTSVAGKSVVFIQEEYQVNGFTDDESCGAKAEALKLGFKYSTTGPSQFTAAAQIPYVEAILAKHPAGVLIGPDDAVALRRAIVVYESCGHSHDRVRHLPE